MGHAVRELGSTDQLSWFDPASQHLLQISVSLGKLLSTTPPPLGITFFIYKSSSSGDNVSTHLPGMLSRLNKVMHVAHLERCSRQPLLTLTAASLSRNPYAPHLADWETKQVCKKTEPNKTHPALSKLAVLYGRRRHLHKTLALHCTALKKKVKCSQCASDCIHHRRAGSKAYTQVTIWYSVASGMPWMDFHVIPRESPVMRGHEPGCDLCIKWR